MEGAIEYISAGIIISLILGMSIQFSTNMVADRVNRIEQEAGFKVADKIIDILLLSPGKPNNWSRSLETPQSMGLALENAIKPYQLDLEKVSRLRYQDDNYIPPYMVRDLLGLGAYYYITININPIYRISVTDLNGTKFSVTVRNQWDAPTPNVNVTAAYTNLQNITLTDIVSFMDGSLEGSVFKSNMTDSSGTCGLDFSGSGPRNTLIVLADQLGIKSLITWPDLSDDVIGEIEASMGSSVEFNVETVYRNVEINGLNYAVKLTVWTS